MFEALSMRRDAPNLPSAPTPVPPGLSSAQDFPPLAAPAQQPIPVAPKLPRKITARAGTPVIKPVVSGLPSAPATQIQPSEDSASLGSKEIDLLDMDIPGSDEGGHASQSMPKAEGKRPEARFNNAPSPTSANPASDASKTVEKRARPDSLDLDAVKRTQKETAAMTNESNFPPLAPSQPATPATVASQASAPTSTRKNQPKTIRLSGTPKYELPSPVTAPSHGSGQASRRPSITSLNRPETPVSERISDNVSYTSASISRANSPPPSKVGSAPLRRMTKSQQKKDRQERAKKAEEEVVKKEEPASRVEETVVQAPIVGRKKKTKKAKEKGTTADSTPAVTRPASPEPEVPTGPAAKEDMPAPPPAEAAKVTKESKRQIKLPPIVPAEPEPSSSVPPTPAVPEPSQGIPAQSTAANIFNDLQASGELPHNAIDTLFKPINGVSHRFEHNLDPRLISNGYNIPFTPEQLSQLDNDEPVVVVHDSRNALLVFPNRRCLKGLTPAQAARYKDLHLQGRRAILSPPNTDGLAVDGAEGIDRLMPKYQSYTKNPATTAPAAPAMPETAPTPQLPNRFADQSMVQALPPAPLSVNMQLSTSRSLMARTGRPELQQWHAERGAMNIEDAEAALAAERKQTEGLEKRLNVLIRKNRRLVLGSGN